MVISELDSMNGFPKVMLYELDFVGYTQILYIEKRGTRPDRRNIIHHSMKM